MPDPKELKGARTVSTSLLAFAGVVLFVGMGLFGLNYWHASRCAEAHSPEELKGFLDGVTKRLLTAESQTIHNSLLMEKVLSLLETRLVAEEARELKVLQQKSQDEAVRVTLQLSSQPAPLRPEFPLDVKYLDAEVLGDAIDEVLDKVGELGDDDDKKDDFFIASASAAGEGLSLKDGGAGGEGGADSSPSDEELTAMCKGWKEKYSVVQGVSWGALPFDLQGKWMKLKCDSFLTLSQPLR